MHDPNHVIVRISDVLKRPRVPVEPTAAHRVYESLALVHVVREPHVLRFRGLQHSHPLDLHAPQLQVPLADEVRLHDVVAVPRPDGVPLRAAPLRRPSEQLGFHLLDASARRDDVRGVGEVAHLVLGHAVGDVLDVRHQRVAIRLHAVHLVVDFDHLQNVRRRVPKIRLVGTRRQMRVHRPRVALLSVRALVLELPNVVLQVVRVHVHGVNVSAASPAVDFVHVLALLEIKRVAREAQRVRRLPQPTRAVAQARAVVLTRAVLARLARGHASVPVPAFEARTPPRGRVAHAVLRARFARDLARGPGPALKEVIVPLALLRLGARVLKPLVSDPVAHAIAAVQRLPFVQVVVRFAVPALNLPVFTERPLHELVPNVLLRARGPDEVPHREQRRDVRLDAVHER
mmetsp:Transcript_14940/g.53795  ORF Transcript_14940/g.53795 Transcript_14940/m.53795 type:complete len:402 (+) Transcript_14940:713-1918(+)